MNIFIHTDTVICPNSRNLWRDRLSVGGLLKVDGVSVSILFTAGFFPQLN